MTPNEINLIKTFTELLEQKNEKILELSLAESELKIIKIQEKFQILLSKEEAETAQVKAELDNLVSDLRKEGYISYSIRDKYNIVNK